MQCLLGASIAAGRIDQGIAETMADGRQAGRCGIAQIADLDRRRTAGHGGKAVPGRVACEIDQHIDAVSAQQSDQLSITQCMAFAPGRAGGTQAVAQCIVALARGVQQRLEAALVQIGQQWLEQIAHRMLAEIGRQETDAQAPRQRTLIGMKRRQAVPDAAMLLAVGAVFPQQGSSIEMLAVVEHQQHIAVGRAVVGAQPQRLAIGPLCRFELPGIGQQVAELAVGACVGRRLRNALPADRQRSLRTAQAPQGNRVVVQRVAVKGATNTLVVSNSFGMFTARHLQGRAAGDEFQPCRRDGNRPLDLFQCRIEVTLLKQHQSEVVQDIRVARMGQQQVPVKRGGLDQLTAGVVFKGLCEHTLRHQDCRTAGGHHGHCRRWSRGQRVAVALLVLQSAAARARRVSVRLQVNLLSSRFQRPRSVARRLHRFH